MFENDRVTQQVLDPTSDPKSGSKTRIQNPDFFCLVQIQNLFGHTIDPPSSVSCSEYPNKRKKSEFNIHECSMNHFFANGCTSVGIFVSKSKALKNSLSGICKGNLYR